MSLDLIVILPAYNEETRITGVIDGIRAHAPEADIVVIDDGSHDATAARARKAGAVVLSLPFNMGYGCALQTGYKYCLARGYEYLVQMDSDGQHEPSGIIPLLERVRSGQYDICIGSRFLEGKTYKIPAGRRMGMILFRRVASFLVHKTITDPTSGFQAMNRKVVEFFARDSYPVDYPDTDVLVMLHRHGFELSEAPVTMRASAADKSIHAGLRPVYYLFKMALVIPLNLLRKEI